jgi:hypothetical protein
VAVTHVDCGSDSVGTFLSAHGPGAEPKHRNFNIINYKVFFHDDFWFASGWFSF